MWFTAHTPCRVGEIPTDIWLSFKGKQMYFFYITHVKMFLQFMLKLHQTISVSLVAPNEIADCLFEWPEIAMLANQMI